MRALEPSPRPVIALRTIGVTKVFSGTVALWDVNLDCRSNELVAVHGANGSGKTTLLRILAGLALPTRGHVSWASERPPARPRIGMLSHASHLFDELTALENVTLAAKLARRDETVALTLLGRLGVERYAARPAAELSAGTRRRVGLARTLATGPDVLLVDEPFAGLDESACELVARALVEHSDDGRLVVIATHGDERTRHFATTRLWLEGGRLRGAPIGSLQMVAT